MLHVTIDKDVMISVGVSIIHHTTLKQGVFFTRCQFVGASMVAEPFAYIETGATVMIGVHRRRQGPPDWRWCRCYQGCPRRSGYGRRLGQSDKI